MTDEERAVFEELLTAGMRAVRHLGKELPLGTVLVFSTRYTKAANAAERILDPLRSMTERRAAENDAFS